MLTLTRTERLVSGASTVAHHVPGSPLLVLDASRLRDRAGATDPIGVLAAPDRLAYVSRSWQDALLADFAADEYFWTLATSGGLRSTCFAGQGCLSLRSYPEGRVLAGLPGTRGLSPYGAHAVSFDQAGNAWFAREAWLTDRSGIGLCVGRLSPSGDVVERQLLRSTFAYLFVRLAPTPVADVIHLRLAYDESDVYHCFCRWNAGRIVLLSPGFPDLRPVDCCITATGVICYWAGSVLVVRNLYEGSGSVIHAPSGVQAVLPLPRGALLVLLQGGAAATTCVSDTRLTAVDGRISARGHVAWISDSVLCNYRHIYEPEGQIECSMWRVDEPMRFVTEEPLLDGLELREVDSEHVEAWQGPTTG